MKKMVSALYWTMTMHLVHPQSLHHRSPAQMSPPDNMTSSRALSSRGRGESPHASCNTILTRANADALKASNGDKDPRNRPKMAQYMLEQVPGCLRRRVEETSPGKAQDKLGNPGDKADASSAPGSIKDIGNWPMKPKNTSEHKHRHLK